MNITSKYSWWLATLSILIIFSACKPLQQVETEEMNTDNSEPEKRPSTVDTIVWNNKPDDYPITNPDNDNPLRPIGGDPKNPNNSNSNNSNDNSKPSEVHYNSYKVAILAPFMSNKLGSEEIDNRYALSAIHFYGGAKLALSRLRAEGANFDVEVHDTKNDEGVTASIMAGLSDANLIIGPRNSRPLISAASMAKQNQQILVSPWNPNSIVSENPNYIQVAPSLETHCNEITKNAKSRFKNKQIILVAQGSSSETARLQYFQNANIALEGNMQATPFKEVIIPSGSQASDIDMSPYIQSRDTTVFIIPTFDERFLITMLSRIYIAKSRNPVVIYGMPQWYSFERVSYDYFDKLNVHISASSHVDKNSFEAKEFARNFFNVYNIAPSDEAYMGYDITLYFGRMLMQKGTNFQYQLPEEQGNNYIHTRFRFQPNFPAGTEDFSRIKSYENKYVNILRFMNFEFKRVN